MASPTRWTWVWVDSGSWWWTGRPGVLRFMGLQRVGHDWATELNWTVMNMHNVKEGSWYFIRNKTQRVPFFSPLLNKYLAVPDQEGRVGRSWAQLLLWAHQDYSYMRNDYLWEWPEDEHSRFSAAWNVNRMPCQGRQEGQRCSLDRTCTQSAWPTSGRDITTVEVPSMEWGLQVPPGDPLGTCTRKMSPHNIWLWRPVGFTLGRAGGLWKTETLLLKGSHVNSLALSTSTEAGKCEGRLGHTLKEAH